MSALDACAWLSTYGEAYQHESLARHSTLRLGGPARWFIRVRDRAKLLELLTRLEVESLPWYVIGGGSNVIAPDAGLEAIVIQPELRTMRIDAEGCAVAEAGVITALFARKVTEAGLAGWEWGVGLPGTIGGAIVGNAGCFGGETAEYIASVEAWSKITRRVERYTKDEARFAYRESRFTHEPYLVLSARWQLPRAADPLASQHRMQEIFAIRKRHQPLGRASAGCMFRNTHLPPAEQDRLEILLGARVPEPARTQGVVPTGWLLDRLGYKGKYFGTAQVSPLHANFLLSGAGGSTQEMLALRDTIRMEVFAHTGVLLTPEVRCLGDGANVLH